MQLFYYLLGDVQVLIDHLPMIFFRLVDRIADVLRGGREGFCEVGKFFYGFFYIIYFLWTEVIMLVRCHHLA